MDQPNALLDELLGLISKVAAYVEEDPEEWQTRVITTYDRKQNDDELRILIAQFQDIVRNIESGL